MPFAPQRRPADAGTNPLGSIKALGIAGIGALGATLSAAPAAASAALESRIAGLEAELRLLKNRVAALADLTPDAAGRAVRSGNRRVRVVLYGQVNRALRLSGVRGDWRLQHLDNDTSSSRIGIRADAALGENLSIAATTEVEWQENRRLFTNQLNDGNLRVRARIVDVTLSRKGWGALVLGHGWNATADTGSQSISGTFMVFGAGGCSDDNLIFGAPAAAPGRTLSTGDACGTFDSVRENRIMYVSPEVAGFHARVSHGEQDALAAALYFAGKPFGLSDLRMVAAFGYNRLPGPGASVPGRGRGDLQTFEGSAGLLHEPTGLNLNIALGRGDFLRTQPGNPDAPAYWWISPGWRGKPSSLGLTAIALDFGRYHHVAADTHAWAAGIALRQTIDRAATDLYVGYRYAAARQSGQDFAGISIVILGARIKF